MNLGGGYLSYFFHFSIFGNVQNKMLGGNGFWCLTIQSHFTDEKMEELEK